jgi:hypothetical protein
VENHRTTAFRAPQQWLCQPLHRHHSPSASLSGLPRASNTCW